MQKESCHSACVTGFVYNLVLWFQRQPSLDLCLGSVHNCIVSAVCTDWHHPRNCLSGYNPTSQDLWSISCWNIVLHPELTKASLCVRALLISYILNTSGKHWAYPWSRVISSSFEALVLCCCHWPNSTCWWEQFCRAAGKCPRGQQMEITSPHFFLSEIGSTLPVFGKKFPLYCCCLEDDLTH